MEVLYERCAGLDVHKKSITAHVITPELRETQMFGTMTDDLLALCAWLKSHSVTHVAMESTGVYWKPVYNLLEETEVTVLVVNAYHIKTVPGRKTDVKDAEWIADLLRHGLIRGSFIPDRAQRELRELVRYRRSLVEEQSRELNRLQKVLEGANIKLGNVVSDISGKSARAMLQAITAGEEDSEKLADLARGRLKRKHTVLVRALHGLLGDHQRLMLGAQLDHLDFLEAQLAGLDTEIADRMRPFDVAINLLDEIPGVGRRTAEEVLAETGTDMTQFPSAAHLASWAGVCPGNNQSAGKRKSGKTRKGNPHLRATLVRAAHAASRSRNKTYLSTRFWRLTGRRGRKRAALAVGHTILVIIYHMLKNGTPYVDLGADHFDRLNEKATMRRAVQRLQALGYRVMLEKEEDAGVA